MSIIASIFSGLGSGLLAPIFGYFTTARNDDLSGFQAGATADTTRYTALLNADVEMAQIRQAQNQWWGARLIMLLVAGSCALHFSAVMLDSVPLFWHVVGSWSVPKLPAPYDSYESEILLSFFILTPAAPVLSAVTSWLHRQ